MRKIIFLSLVFLVFFLMAVFLMVFGVYSITSRVVDSSLESGDSVEFDYTYTKAICDGNKCRDYEIACKNGEAIRVDPISGMVIFPDDWEDGRKDRELCDR